MDDTPISPQDNPAISAFVIPKIDETKARELACAWIESQNFFTRKDTYRIGKAVMVYYPFWEFVREDGNNIKTLYRPACGTLMTDLQKYSLNGELSTDVPDNFTALPTTINSSYYHQYIHGIARGERLVAVPFWLISYKFEHSIFMLKIDAGDGSAMPEWHPFKESINWRKIALIAFIPLTIISFAAVLLHPALFVLDLAIVIYLIYRGKMFSIINAKRKEGNNGS